jgi:hypothetical protein
MVTTAISGDVTFWSVMERRLRKHYNDTAAKFPGQYVVPIIQPSDDDDIEVFNEAMRRTKNEMQPKPTLRRRG